MSREFRYPRVLEPCERQVARSLSPVRCTLVGEMVASSTMPKRQQEYTAAGSCWTQFATVRQPHSEQLLPYKITRITTWKGSDLQADTKLLARHVRAWAT